MSQQKRAKSLQDLFKPSCLCTRTVVQSTCTFPDTTVELIISYTGAECWSLELWEYDLKCYFLFQKFVYIHLFMAYLMMLSVIQDQCHRVAGLLLINN
jgi:hypothetical protein